MARTGLNLSRDVWAGQAGILVRSARALMYTPIKLLATPSAKNARIALSGSGQSSANSVPLGYLVKTKSK